ncbi:MAG: beta-glucosidase [Treponema sp.]|jgi:beta-glucosidase|nr:beta-glucosidase [Treponema sp.]
MKRSDFPPDFLWGTATASFQVEGTEPGDGRGGSIWDTFCATPGKVHNNDTGKTACEHYKRYAQDVALMGELGINAYRFSIAWPRLLPDGTGRVNQKGIDFYNRLIDELLKKNIAPCATLYHWDLPQKLQDTGGWATRAICGPWAEYVNLAYEHFGDRVKQWFTHNEPWVAAFAGNLQGRHAPGNTDLATAVAASYHLVLTHGQAIEAFRQSKARDGKIGVVLNLYPAVPAADSEADKHAADLSDQFQNRWFLDPVYKGCYPQELREIFEKAGAPLPEKPGDLDFIKKQKPDFLGINYYFRKVLRAAASEDIAQGKIPHPALPIVEVIPPGARTTEMGWEIYPQGMADLLLRIKDDYGNPPLFITENGASFPDDKFAVGTKSPYMLDDEDRRQFIEDHIAAGLRARKAGANLAGYFVWSFMDNFEWARGYSKRFGVFYVDYKTQERSWKKSARWYESFLKG